MTEAYAQEMQSLAEKAAALEAKRRQRFIEERLLLSQWCDKLVAHYNSMTPDFQEKVPPLPGTTPEELLPSIFATDPLHVDWEQYEREVAVLKNLQMEMTKLAHAINTESMQWLE